MGSREDGIEKEDEMALAQTAEADMDLFDYAHKEDFRPPEPLGELALAKADLHARLRAGEMLTCPVCDQTCKIYKRKLNSGMARALIAAHLAHGERAFTMESVLRHMIAEHPDIRHSGGDPAKLRFWGLLESRGDGGGEYQITPRGTEFVLRQARVAKHVYVYNNELLKLSNETTDIIDALGEHFDYYELMQPAPLPRQDEA